MARIYIMDGNPFFSETQEKILSQAFPSAGIRKFINSENLLSELEDHPPDVIFMDISLYDMDGLQLIRAIKAKNRAITVIVITGYDGVEYAGAASEAGADAFLSKNRITPAELVEVARTLINNA